jgi:hypothetical protein
MMRDHIDQNLRCGADRLPLLLSLIATRYDKLAANYLAPAIRASNPA